MNHTRAMRVLTRVADLGSLSAASQEMGYARGAASAIVKELEDYLGVRLVERTTRALRLTEEGEAYVRRARGILADIEALDEDIGSGERVASGHLRVQMPPGIARVIIGPAITDFLARNPEVSVEILSMNSVPDFVTGRLDAALFVGPIADSGIVARRVGAVRLVTVATPAYLAARGTPRALADLKNHEAIRLISSASGQTVPWMTRTENGDMPYQPRGRLSFEAVEPALAAAIAGAGLMQVARYLVEPLLDSGQLVTVLPELDPSPSEIRFLTLSQRHKPRKLVVLEDFLTERCRALR